MTRDDILALRTPLIVFGVVLFAAALLIMNVQLASVPGPSAVAVARKDATPVPVAVFAVNMLVASSGPGRAVGFVSTAGSNSRDSSRSSMLTLRAASSSMLNVMS